MKKKILLFDGSSLAFRAFYAFRDIERFTNSEGLHTNALYAFHLMFQKVLEQEAPTHALVAWDASRTTFRTELYADYKGGRQSAPDEFREQMPYFNVLLDAFGVCHTELANYEADDIIGTFARLGAEAGYEVVIISGDRDLIQLAGEQVRVDITRRGVTHLESYTPARIEEELGLSPQQIIDMKGLMGDSSDNYPGVTGIGEKTALKLLHEYGSMEGVYEHLADISGKKRQENLRKEKEQAFLSKKLATIDTSVPVKVQLADTTYEGSDVEALLSFYKEMDFEQFTTNLLEEHDIQDPEMEDLPPVHVKRAEDEADLKAFFEEEVVKTFFIESFEANYHVAEPLAVAFASEEACLVAEPALAWESPSVKAWLADDSQEKIVFDVKRLIILLVRQGLTLAGVSDDILIGAYLLHARDYADDLTEVAREFKQQALAYDETIYGKGKKQQLPEDAELLEHLARKCQAILNLREPILEELKQQDMHDLYAKMELPLAFVLAGMEEAGVQVDRACLSAMQEKLQAKLDELIAAIHQEAGHEFNVNSTQQLSDVLFEELGLPGGKKTKSGRYSTAQAELEKLAGQAPIIEYLLTYRQLAKLQSTYIEGLQDYILADGKIHTRFTQTLTTTGRLSSKDPNLQNIPIRTPEGRQIRQAFVPSQPGYEIYSSDYSQIELRVLAHISGDKHLQEAFKAGKDIHRATASRVFGIEPAEVGANERRSAKAVNFGIVYGISDYGLSQNLGISRPKAQDFIDSYFESFPGVKKYMTAIVEEAREAGYVETLFHRRRYLPDIKAKNFNRRRFAERTAMNTPIQGTAADIIKLAMVKMAEVLKQENLQARLLLQVHDELIFEAPAEEIARLEELVPQVMAEAVDLTVPLTVETKHGSTWYDAD